MIISLIVAADEKNGIGRDNQLLCHLPADLRFFKQTTTGHHILMGRKTFDSIGKPLPNRVNIIVSGNSNLKTEGCVVVSSIEEAIELAQSNKEDELFIIGGATIYKQAINRANRIYLTRIHSSFDADVFFPVLDNSWRLIKEENHLADEKNKYNYSFNLYERS